MCVIRVNIMAEFEKTVHASWSVIIKSMTTTHNRLLGFRTFFPVKHFIIMRLSLGDRIMRYTP